MTSSRRAAANADWAPVAMSHMAARTSNPIRAIVDHMKVTPNPDKPMISLSIGMVPAPRGDTPQNSPSLGSRWRPSPTMAACCVGDPTIFGNFKAPETATTALIDALHAFKFNGYPPAHGYEAARAAVARTHTRPSAPVTPDDVIIASGCSGAIELAITVLANPGQNILMPRPGFSLYQVICDAYKVETRFYDLVVRLLRRNRFGNASSSRAVSACLSAVHSVNRSRSAAGRSR